MMPVRHGHVSPCTSTVGRGVTRCMRHRQCPLLDGWANEIIAIRSGDRWLIPFHSHKSNSCEWWSHPGPGSPCLAKMAARPIALYQPGPRGWPEEFQPSRTPRICGQVLGPPSPTASVVRRTAGAPFRLLQEFTSRIILCFTNHMWLPSTQTAGLWRGNKKGATRQRQRGGRGQN